VHQEIDGGQDPDGRGTEVGENAKEDAAAAVRNPAAMFGSAQIVEEKSGDGA
jgi:hypothetical protein